MPEERRISPAVVIGGGLLLLGGAAALAYALSREAPPKVYTCPYCGAVFDTEAALLAHIEAEHPEEPPAVFTCPYCGSTFTTEAELAAHILAEHPEVPPELIACPYCGFEDTRAEIISHILSAHPGYIFTCPHCGELFITGEELSAHIQSVHPDMERFISFEPTQVKAGEPFYPVVKVWLTPKSDMEAYLVRMKMPGISVPFWERHRYEWEAMFAPYQLFQVEIKDLPLNYGENTIYGKPTLIWGHWIDDEMRFYPGELDDKIVLRQGVFYDGEGRPAEYAVVAEPLVIDTPGSYNVLSSCQWNELRKRNGEIEYWDYYWAWEDMVVATIEVI